MSKNVAIIFFLSVLITVSIAFFHTIPTAKALQTEVVNFCLVYEGKQFRFSSKDFLLNTNTFETNFNASKFGRFGTKSEKLATIKRAEDLGFGVQVGMDYIFFGLNKKIDAISKNLFRQAKDAEMKIRPKKSQPFEIKKEVVGVEVDIDRLYEEMFKQYQKSNNIVLKIPILKTMPKVYSQSLKEQTCYRGGFSTSIASSGPDRKNNIYRSLNSLNGKVLAPNEVFSFNKTIGRRTAENGYRTAKIIVDGEFVDGTGGGVCQTSTTLYNAVLLSGLEVLRVSRHSQRVSYVPPALDAMVNYGSSDLVFKNNTKSNIYIIAKYDKSNITISIYGESLPKGVYYKTKSEIIEKLFTDKEKVIIDSKGEHCDKVIYKDESFVFKPAKEGVVARSYLQKYRNGELIETKFLRQDKYPPHELVRVFGNKERKTVETHIEIAI